MSLEEMISNVWNHSSISLYSVHTDPAVRSDSSVNSRQLTRIVSLELCHSQSTAGATAWWAVKSTNWVSKLPQNYLIELETGDRRWGWGRAAWHVSWLFQSWLSVKSDTVVPPPVFFWVQKLASWGLTIYNHKQNWAAYILEQTT